MTEPSGDRIVQALVAEGSALRAEAVRLMVDRAFASRIRDLVDFEEARRITVSALGEENLARIVGRHVIPGFRRYEKSAQGSPVKVGELVPEGARVEIRKIIATTPLPRGKWAEGAIDPALMRRLFAPVWVNLLLSFAKRMPVPGVGGASGAAAAATRGVSGIAGKLTQKVQERAERLVDAGRSVMGGLGAEVERRVQAAAREFSDGAAEVFREALGERLRSDEGKALVEQITRHAVDHVMATSLGDLGEDMARLPIESVLRVVPPIVAHATPHAFVREIVTTEVTAFLALEGDRTLEDLLAELGIAASVREILGRSLDGIAQGLFASPGFADWLGRLLDA